MDSTALVSLLRSLCHYLFSSSFSSLSFILSISHLLSGFPPLSPACLSYSLSLIYYLVFLLFLQLVFHTLYLSSIIWFSSSFSSLSFILSISHLLSGFPPLSPACLSYSLSVIYYLVFPLFLYLVFHTLYLSSTIRFSSSFSSLSFILSISHLLSGFPPLSPACLSYSLSVIYYLVFPLFLYLVFHTLYLSSTIRFSSSFSSLSFLRAPSHYLSHSMSLSFLLSVPLSLSISILSSQSIHLFISGGLFWKWNSLKLYHYYYLLSPLAKFTPPFSESSVHVVKSPFPFSPVCLTSFFFFH